MENGGIQFGLLVLGGMQFILSTSFLLFIKKLWKLPSAEVLEENRKEDRREKDRLWERMDEIKESLRKEQKENNDELRKEMKEFLNAFAINIQKDVEDIKTDNHKDIMLVRTDHENLHNELNQRLESMSGVMQSNFNTLLGLLNKNE